MVRGSTRLESIVRSRTSGVATTTLHAAGHRQRATLMRISSTDRAPSHDSRSRSPAIVAAALLPSPAHGGIPLSTSTSNEGGRATRNGQ